MVKKFSFIFLSCLLFACSFFIVNDRFAKINSVDAASQTIDNMFTPYNLRFTNNWLFYTAGFNFTYESVRCWTDGTNIFYSSGADQYVLDTSNNTWTSKTWNGLSSFNGNNIWTDGANIYYSNDTTQYILDISTSTWTAKTWFGLSSVYAQYIWTDGTNIYHSNGTDQYVLNTTNSTWTLVTFNLSFRGDRIWTDGTNIYYSYNGNNYALDTSNNTWISKTWNGLSSFRGDRIWTDGTNIFYSNEAEQYVLDISNSTWTSKTWTGLSSFLGSEVFVFDNIIIIPESSSPTWYMLEKDISGGGDNTNTYYHFTGSNFNLLSHASRDGYSIANFYFDIEDISLNQFTIDFNYSLLYSYAGANNQTFFNTSSDTDTTSVVLGLGVDYSLGYNTSNDFDLTYPFLVNISSSSSGWSNSDIIGCTISTQTGTLTGGYNTAPYVDGIQVISYTFQYFNSSNDQLILTLTGTYDQSVMATQPLTLINRTYYFSSTNNESGDYQSGYNAGYADGSEAGFNNGINVGTQESYQSGYNAGLATGTQNGYDNGYYQGVLDGASGDKFTFLSLISAVVDAPLTAFSSLLNFNVLGINILNFCLGLLTLALLLAVLKFLLGGK